MLPTIGYIDATTREPTELALMIANKTGTDLQDTVNYLRDYLSSYEITIDGTNIRFRSEEESYDGSFPARLLVEMYRENMLDYMFLWPTIVPH